MNKYCRKIYYLVKKIELRHSQLSDRQEDAPVLDFLRTLEDKKYDYLEVASGRGRFALAVRSKFQNFNIRCLEINHDLAVLTSHEGLETIEKNILENGLISETFDIIHASHIVEHFKYPEVTLFLDEMFRLVKKDGYIIILMISNKKWEKIKLEL